MLLIPDRVEAIGDIFLAMSDESRLSLPKLEGSEQLSDSEQEPTERREREPARQLDPVWLALRNWSAPRRDLT
jgi:hypothetical protein